MTQTIDHPSRTDDQGLSAAGQPTTGDLYALVRNTRSWVMVIAWIVVIQATLAIGFGAIMGIEAAKANRNRIDLSTYAECINAGHMVDYCLADN